ncbi:MAG: hypothetical protein FWH22_02290 [Fibromonadales bacterium]|nr:hypothetical protein [Fibromonadales bacterium]
MQHEMLTRKITRSAKHSNMGGYINVKNRENPVIGVIGVQTVRHSETSIEVKNSYNNIYRSQFFGSKIEKSRRII